MVPRNLHLMGDGETLDVHDFVRGRQCKTKRDETRTKRMHSDATGNSTEYRIIGDLCFGPSPGAPLSRRRSPDIGEVPDAGTKNTLTTIINLDKTYITDSNIYDSATDVIKFCAVIQLLSGADEIKRE